MTTAERRGVAVFQAAIVVLAALVGPLAVGAAAAGPTDSAAGTATADTPGRTTTSAGSSIPSTGTGPDRRASSVDSVADSDAATVDAPSNGTFYASGAGFTTVAPNVTVTDEGATTTVDTAKVIIENPQPGDRLTATEQHGIDVSYNASNGTLTLSGSGNSMAEVQDVFQSVRYRNANGDPALDPRRIVFSLGAVEPWTDPGSTSASNYHYYVVNTSDRDWSTARDLANDDANAIADQNGYLATITSAAENEYVSGLSGTEPWIGASDAGDEGNFTWRTGPEAGDPLTYTNWASGEPSDSGSGEDYVEYFGLGYWNDLSGGSTNDWVIEYGNQTNDVKTVFVDDEADVDPSDLAGDGTAANPYVITNVSELQAIEDDRSANYTLGSDVDGFETRYWNEGRGFDPIGTGSAPFVGTVDGGQHAITNLTIDRPGEDDVGLFGVVGNDGTVEDVSVNATVAGDRRVGVAAGASNGLLSEVSAHGGAAGNRTVGGLVGQNAGDLRAVYAESDAAGGDRVGGLVGYNLGTVNRTYAAGAVTGDATLGGLVAEDIGTVGSAAYWDTQASGLSSSAGGTGLTTAEMTGEAARTNMSGLDISDAGPWQVREGDYPPFDWQSAAPTARDDVYTQSVTTEDRPPLTVTASEGVLANDSDPDDPLTASVVSGPDVGTLTFYANGSFEYTSPKWFAGADSFTYRVSDGTTTDTATVTVRVDAEPAPVSLSNLAGNGSASNPYVITNASELQAMANDRGANYVLGEDVEAGVTGDWNGGGGFDPVGPDPSTSFTGTFDGAGHAIRNLTIDRSGTDYVGLFGALDGTVRNVSLADAFLAGGSEVGALVGNNAGTVRDASANGFVSATGLAGGLVGDNVNTVVGSSAAVTVSIDNSAAGGLVGFNGGTVRRSYATGDVDADENVGGLVGVLDGTIERSYATGTVTVSGNSGVGGLVGPVLSGSVSDSYWDVQSTGESTSGGGTGLTTAEMTGYAAVTNMTGLDFSQGGAWTPTADDYPVLDWQNDLEAPDDGYRLAVLPNLPSSTLSVTAAGGVLANDSDPEGGALTVSLVSGTTNGTLTLASNGSFEYTSDAGFDGTDTFTYEVTDPDGGLARATVALDVDPSPTALDIGTLAGDGSASNPYVITNATELQAAYGAPDANYVLGSDVDASATADWFGGQGFVPLGNASTPFTGSLAGDAHRIANLSVDRPGESDVGLVGYLGSTGTVRNLTVVDASVTGDERVGAVLGTNKGTITRTSANGSVAGNLSVGGLAGLNDGTVAATYARSGATGGDQVGGLVGYNLDTVERSYAAGTVTGDSAVGGLVGESTGGTATDAYWDTGASGQATSAGGTGLTTGEMTGLAATTNMTGLAFNDTWWPVTSPDDYPVLVTQTDAFFVSFADPPAEVLAGSNVSLEVPVENVGGEPGSGTVNLAVNGSVVDSATVSLAGGATATVTLNWSVPDGATGDRLLAAASGDDRTEATTTIATYAPLGTVWNRTTAGRSQFASPAVGPDRVFVGGLDDTVYALNRTTGTVAWTVDRSGSLADSSPAYASGTVYVGSGGGVIYALNASTGAQEWNVTTDSAVVSSPRVAGGTVYVGSNDGTVLAIDATSGSVQWTADVGAAVYSRPAVDAGTVYVTADDGRLLALDASDGSQQWSVDTGTELGHSGPTVAGDTVYVAADPLYAVNASSGAVRWQTAYGGATGSTPAVSGGTVYVGAANGDVVALAADTGAIEWTYATGDAVEASPAVVSGRVVVSSLDGAAYLLNASTGGEVQNTSLGAASRSSPTVVGDRAFLGAASGEIRALANLDGTAGVTTTSTATATATADRSRNESVPPVVGPDPPANGTPVPGPEPPGNVTPVPSPDPPGNVTPGPGPGPQPPANGTPGPGQSGGQPGSGSQASPSQRPANGSDGGGDAGAGSDRRRDGGTAGQDHPSVVDRAPQAARTPAR